MNPDEQAAAIRFLNQALGDCPTPKILIVDDDENDVVLHLAVLKKFSCDVIVAKCADDAVRLIKENGIDLILLDARLPQTPAEEVVSVAMGIMPEASIIVVTGYPDSATRSLAVRKGAKLILSKPLTEEIVSTILHPKTTT